LKSIIRCKECANRVYDLGVGFVPNITVVCGMIGCEVSQDDGCTFGNKGDGSYTSKEIPVSIEGYAAVNGTCGYY